MRKYEKVRYSSGRRSQCQCQSFGITSFSVMGVFEIGSVSKSQFQFVVFREMYVKDLRAILGDRFETGRANVCRIRGQMSIKCEGRPEVMLHHDPHSAMKLPALLAFAIMFLAGTAAAFPALEA